MKPYWCRPLVATRLDAGYPTWHEGAASEGLCLPTGWNGLHAPALITTAQSTSKAHPQVFQAARRWRANNACRSRSKSGTRTTLPARTSRLVSLPILHCPRQGGRAVGRVRARDGPHQGRVNHRVLSGLRGRGRGLGRRLLWCRLGGGGRRCLGRCSGSRGGSGAAVCLCLLGHRRQQGSGL